MKPIGNIPEEDVVLKLSVCGTCDGAVRVAVEHLLDVKSKNEFIKEVMDYNLGVREILLTEYRKGNTKWCDCKRKPKTK